MIMIKTTDLELLFLDLEDGLELLEHLLGLLLLQPRTGTIKHKVILNRIWKCLGDC